MRSLFLASLLLLTACGQDESNADASNDALNQGVATRQTNASIAFDSGGRNQLCLAEGRAGLIAYAAEGDTNCTVRGQVLEQTGERLVIQPDGDQGCRVEATWQDSALTFGAVSPACAYYCGPKASFAGARFHVVPASRPATDLAGDPLC